MVFPTLLVGALASRCFAPTEAAALTATLWNKRTIDE